MYCYNCTQSTEESTKTISTTNVSATAMSNYAKSGDGQAKIKYLGNNIEIEQFTINSNEESILLIKTPLNYISTVYRNNLTCYEIRLI